MPHSENLSCCSSGMGPMNFKVTKILHMLGEKESEVWPEKETAIETCLKPCTSAI